MNHDATHCADYMKNTCPRKCYRAQLTEELRNIYYPLPTSWANFKGTKECPKPLKGEQSMKQKPMFELSDDNFGAVLNLVKAKECER